MRASTILAGLALVLGATLIAGPVQAQTNDHLKCYRVRDPLALRGTVDLDSLQFGLDPDCRIRRARKFCVPVSKNVQSATVNRAPIELGDVSGQELLDDYICYRIRCPSPGPPDTGVSDQFGSRTLRRFTAFELCTPANKCPVPQSVSISTGNSGAIGAPDPLGWILESAPIGTLGSLPRVATIISPNSAWGFCSDPNAQWISAETACTSTLTGPNCPAGVYTYKLCWTQCGSTNLTFDALADNIGKVFLDKTFLPPLLTLGTPTSFASTVSGIGPHILEVDVQNFGFSGGGGTATGMELCGSILGSDVQFVPCPIVPKVVFVTRATRPGDFGSAAAADVLCQQAAQSGGLPGAFLAWVSDSTTSPSARFNQSSVPYVGTDSFDVANDWSDLTSGDLIKAIDHDAFGVPVSGTVLVWTGTDETGSPSVLGGSCTNWTSASSGVQGVPGRIDTLIPRQWTQAGNVNCNVQMRLYCFEQ